jgi:titin
MSEGEKSYKMVFDGAQRADILTYTVTTGITKTREYHFKMTAINFVGTSQFSSVLTSLAAVVPSVPQKVAIIESSLGGVTLEWSAPDDDGGSRITGYYIYYK